MGKQAGSDVTLTQDQAKSSALANQWQEDQLKGFNRDNSASLNDHGYAADANSRDEGANAKSSNWANADAAKSAGQARHDMDENIATSSNNKWRKSDSTTRPESTRSSSTTTT